MRRDRALNTSMWDVMLSVWYRFSKVSYEPSVSIHEIEKKNETVWQNTLCHITEDSNLHSHHCENSKSYKSSIFLSVDFAVGLYVYELHAVSESHKYEISLYVSVLQL